jgi:uncharacterized protein (DUF697 family)/energy-coupling factor transporter ATP-binding protein EcfA2
MTEKRERSWLGLGVFLALALWTLEVLNHLLGEWSVYLALLGTAGAIAWWVKQKSAPITSSLQLPQAIDSGVVKRALAQAEQVLQQLGEEIPDPQEAGNAAVQPHLTHLQAQMERLNQGTDRNEIHLLVMGATGSGKTTLVQWMQANWAGQAVKPVHISEASCSAISPISITRPEDAVNLQVMGADLVLFLVTGDITESEYQTLKYLATIRRTLLVLSKQDQYLPEERQTILEQLQRRSLGVLPGQDVVAIAAAPNPLKVRQHQPDGSVQEWQEEQSADIAPLVQRLDYILQNEARQLILTSSFNNAVSLTGQAKAVLNDIRRARALPVVEQFQWIAAGTAFASPLPAVDLVATVAINVQMIIDLGTIYRHRFSVQQAKTVAATMGSLMLKLGLVEVSTRAIATFLKSNAITYIAGGTIQGISAAYLTRVAGLTLIEYFHSQEPNLTVSEASPLAVERFSQILQQVFQQNQQLSFLQSFIGQAVNQLTSLLPQPRITPDTVSPPASLPAATTEPLNLEQNGTGVRLKIPDLETTKLPS